jgi:hypothetical protein
MKLNSFQKEHHDGKFKILTKAMASDEKSIPPPVFGNSLKRANASMQASKEVPLAAVKAPIPVVSKSSLPDAKPPKIDVLAKYRKLLEDQG